MIVSALSSRSSSRIVLMMKTIGVAAAVLCLSAGPAWGFQTAFRRPATLGARIPHDARTLSAPSNNPRHGLSSTSLNMFMGSDGGLLGIGTPELFTILLVGYFILGPSDLYKIVKEVGKFIQNVRTFSTDLSTTFENNMESQLQLQEIRKAQQELTDAFSFRRSINVDDQAEAFAKPEPVAAAAAAATAATTEDGVSTKRKKIRRRVKKRAPPPEAIPQTVPDLEMPEPATAAATTTPPSTESTMTPEEIATIEREFDQYTDDNYVMPSAKPDMASANNETGKVWYDEPDRESTMRFQQQLSGNWNDQIMANQDKLSPLATIMDKIALLEKEKKSSIQRLEEEFEKRKELEDQFYKEQRSLLEEASRQVQEDAILGSKQGKLV